MTNTEQKGAFMAMDDATSEALYALFDRMQSADDRYGRFASTHEAMGVASEEWDEFRAAVHQNDLVKIKHEALDVAAVFIRLHLQINNRALRERSVK